MRALCYDVSRSRLTPYCHHAVPNTALQMGETMAEEEPPKQAASVGRELVAFAFVEESYSKSGDIVSGLLPLFSPILGKRPNRVFDAAQFAADVQAAYDIPMSPIVADGLVERLAEAGLLRLESGESHTYRINPNTTAAHSGSDAQVDRLLAEFCDFASEALARVRLTATVEELQSAFLKRLTTAHFLAFVDRREKNYFKGNTLTLRKVEDDDQDAVQLAQALDVVCAEFALAMMEAGNESADLLLRMVAGALIAEVVLTLQTPSSGELLEKLAVVVDGPLILDQLDLSTPELHEYASDLFDLIGRAHIRRIVFKHTVEEIKGTVQGPLKALQRGEEPYGPLGSRIRTSAQHAAYARAVHDDLEARLVDLGFDIVDADEFASDANLSFCDLATEESLRNNIGPVMFNLERRIRDARSVATVLRLRGVAQRASSIASTGWILITRNDAVANRSQGFLEVRKIISREEVPPAITDRRFAGYLWFAVGGSIGALSRRKLVANCSYVMTPRTDVVSKARQYLCDLDPAKADIFASLMRDQRAQRCLMKSTLGFPSAIRRDNAEQLLEEIRLSVAAEVQVMAAAKEAEAAARHEAELASIASTRQAEQLESETSILRLRQDLEKRSFEASQAIGQRDAQVGDLSDRLKSMESVLSSDIDRRIQRAVSSANLATMALKAILAIVYLSLVGVSYWYLPSEKAAYTLGVTLIVALAAFWIVPQYIYDRIAVPLWMARFRARCEDLGVSESAGGYALEPLEGIARPRRIDHPVISP